MVSQALNNEHVPLNFAIFTSLQSAGQHYRKSGRNSTVYNTLDMTTLQFAFCMPNNAHRVYRVYRVRRGESVPMKTTERNKTRGFSTPSRIPDFLNTFFEYFVRHKPTNIEICTIQYCTIYLNKKPFLILV